MKEKSSKLDNAIGQARYKNKKNKRRAFWIFIVGVLLICTAFVTGSLVEPTSYNKGKHYEHAKMVAQYKRHPRVDIKYRKSRLSKKKVPMVHIENATNKQIEKAVRNTHKDDFAAFKKYLNKYSNNNNNQNNKSKSKSKDNQQNGQVTLQQALKAEAKANHSSENAKD